MIQAAEKREPLEVYHDFSDGRITRTALGVFKDSPYLFEQTYLTRRMPPRKPEAKFSIGTASHTLVLEPERFEATVRLIPGEVLAKNGARSTNAYKDWSAQWEPGTVLLKAEEYDAVHWMAEQVWANKDAETLIKLPGAIETTIPWTDDATGIGCKCRPDKACGCAILGDLKSCHDVTPRGFEKAVAAFRYDEQAAYYSAGWEQKTGHWPDFYFICVEKNPPYRVRMYELSAEDVQEARWSNAAALAELKRCQDTNTWPDEGAGEITTISLPPWAKRRGANLEN